MDSDGAPMGVERPITSVGVFPRVDPCQASEEMQSIRATLEPGANYKSFKEAGSLAEDELSRLRAAGYTTRVGS